MNKKSEQREPLATTLLSILKDEKAHPIDVVRDFGDVIVARTLNLTRQKTTIDQLISEEEWQEVVSHLSIFLQNSELREEFFNSREISLAWVVFLNKFPHVLIKDLA